MAKRFLHPSELPKPAENALADLLEQDGENPDLWKITFLWSTDGEDDASGYAVTLRSGEATRRFAVLPSEAAGDYRIVEVTG